MSPLRFYDVGSEGTTGWSIIVETSVVTIPTTRKAIYLERFHVEEATLHHRLESGAIEWLVLSCGQSHHLRLCEISMGETGRQDGETVKSKILKRLKRLALSKA